MAIRERPTGRNAWQSPRAIVGALLAIASMAASAVEIGPGITGAWFDPQQSGHGLFLEVLPSNGLMAFWFTFNPDGTQQAWFGGVGSYAGNTATVPVALTTGGRWVPNFDASKIVNDPWGTLTFTFSDCNSGRVDFTSTLPGYGSNHMTLTRLTSPAGLTCADTNASAVKGLWRGTTSLNESAVAVVVEDGTFYLFYTMPNSTSEAGMIEGTSTAAGGTISSANARNFPIAQREEQTAASSSVSFDGTYTAQGALQLTTSGFGGTRAFTTTYVPGSEASPSLAAIVGNYTGVSGHVSGRQLASWSIDSAGNISGTNAATCVFHGTIVPRADVHAFDWTLDGNVNCIFFGNHLSGVLYYDEATGQMSAFAPYLQRIEHYYLIGRKSP